MNGDLKLDRAVRAYPGLKEKSNAPKLLGMTLFTIMVFPAYMVIPSIGATGNVPHLMALLLFALWLLHVAFGLHDPLPWGHPGRMALAIWLVANMCSYVAMFAGFSGTTDVSSRAAADRWILLLIAGVGITLTTTEAVRTATALKSVVRWVMAGTVVCSIIAMLQFFAEINAMEWISNLLVGFTDNGSGNAYQARDGFMRVSGSTMHPIELSAVTAMLLPLGIWWALFDTEVKISYRVAAPLLIFAANVMTVSRTGLIGLAITALIFIPYLPRVAKQWSIVIAPVGMIMVFFLIPGLVSTLFRSTTAGSNDSSIEYRTDDYPLVWRLFILRPFLGTGPGNWIPDSMKDIFDNQFLQTVTTLGGIGLAAFLLYLLVPLYAAFVAAHYALKAELRCLAGAVATAMLIAAVTSGTFDSLAFQTFALIVPFFIGIGGLVWHMVKEQRSLQNFSAPVEIESILARGK